MRLSHRCSVSLFNKEKISVPERSLSFSLFPPYVPAMTTGVAAFARPEKKKTNHDAGCREYMMVWKELETTISLKKKKLETTSGA